MKDNIFINKGPKGPHILHPSTTCHLNWRIGQDGNFVFPTCPKNTNLADDVEILLPVKFLWISFNRFRGEVENTSANQIPGRSSCFSGRPEKHKFGRGYWDLASCQVSLNSVQWFQKRSRKCLNESEARAAILFSRSSRKTQTWLKIYSSCQVSLNSVQQFQKRSWKCEELMTDGQHVITIAHLSLRLRCTKISFQSPGCKIYRTIYPKTDHWR